MLVTAVFGLVAAVEGFMAEDDAALTAIHQARMQGIVDAVGAIPGVVSEVMDKGEGGGPKALINLRPSDGCKHSSNPLLLVTHVSSLTVCLLVMTSGAGPAAQPILDMLLDHPRCGLKSIF